MFRGRMKPIVLLVALVCIVLGVPAAAVAASGSVTHSTRSMRTIFGPAAKEGVPEDRGT